MPDNQNVVYIVLISIDWEPATMQIRMSLTIVHRLLCWQTASGSASVHQKDIVRFLITTCALLIARHNIIEFSRFYLTSLSCNSVIAATYILVICLHIFKVRVSVCFPGRERLRQILRGNIVIVPTQLTS